MIVTTIGKSYLNSISLPQKITGQYWLNDETEAGIDRLASVEGINGEWVLKSNRSIKILDSKNQPLKNTIIHSLVLIHFFNNFISIIFWTFRFYIFI